MNRRQKGSFIFSNCWWPTNEWFPSKNIINLFVLPWLYMFSRDIRSFSLSVLLDPFYFLLPGPLDSPWVLEKWSAARNTWDWLGIILMDIARDSSAYIWHFGGPASGLATAAVKQKNRYWVEVSLALLRYLCIVHGRWKYSEMRFTEMFLSLPAWKPLKSRWISTYRTIWKWHPRLAPWRGPR